MKLDWRELCENLYTAVNDLLRLEPTLPLSERAGIEAVRKAVLEAFANGRDRLQELDEAMDAIDGT